MTTKLEYIQQWENGSLVIFEVLIAVLVKDAQMKVITLCREYQPENTVGSRFVETQLPDSVLEILAESYAAELERNGRAANIHPTFKQYGFGSYEKNCDKFFDILKTGNL